MARAASCSMPMAAGSWNGTRGTASWRRGTSSHAPSWPRCGATGADNVLLDVRHLDPGTVTSRFPSIYQFCLEYGLDITKEPIPVAPAAHYMMGGLRVTPDGRTNVPGLLTAGETRLHRRARGEPARQQLAPGNAGLRAAHGGRGPRGSDNARRGAARPARGAPRPARPRRRPRAPTRRPRSRRYSR